MGRLREREREREEKTGMIREGEENGDKIERGKDRRYRIVLVDCLQVRNLRSKKKKTKLKKMMKLNLIFHTKFLKNIKNMLVTSFLII